MKWGWLEEQEESFQCMKRKLIESPALIQPDFNKTFYIVVDASSVGTAGYLGQE